MFAAVLPWPGGALRLVTADDRIAERLRERLGALFADVPATGEVELVAAAMPDAAWNDRLSGRLEGNRLIVDLSGAQGEFDLDTQRGRVEIATHIPWFELYFENALRMILVELGARQKRWICHTAALAEAIGNDAYLFFGPSGAGKTTVTELSAALDYRPINDDLVFLSAGPPAVWACPFHGATKIRRFATGQFAVRAMFRLEQADITEAFPLSAATAVRELAQAFVTWRPRSRTEQQQLFAAAESICRSAPMFRLRFRKDGGEVWKAVRTALEGALRPGADAPRTG